MHSSGSAPGELAACLTHVGLAPRPDLAAVRGTAAAPVVAAVALHAVGQPLAVGGAFRAGSTWWCRPDATTIVLVDAPGVLSRTVELLRPEARRRPTLVVEERRLAVLGVMGRRTPAVLRRLGVCDDPRLASPCRTTALGTGWATWLLESDASALCCVAPTDAGAAREAIAHAGRPLGLAHVGPDALALFGMLQRLGATETGRILA